MKKKLIVNIAIPAHQEVKNLIGPSKMRVAIDTFLSLRISQENSEIYKTIGMYNLHKRITKENGFNHNFAGIYKKGNKRYFIKTWTGELKNHHYQAISRELLINGNLCNILFKSKIRTPKVIEYFSTNNALSLVFEYIEGKLLSEYPMEEQASVWLYINQQFRNISLDLRNKKNLINFEKKDKNYYMVTISFITLLSLLSLPRLYRLIFKAYIKALMRFFKLKNERLILNHCDLSPDNILISKGKIYVLDCGRVSLTLPEYDITYISVKPQLRKLYAFISKSSRVLSNDFLGLYLSIQNIKHLDEENARIDYLNNQQR